MSEIKDLKFDDKNMNKHTAKGLSLIEKSLQEDGAGRSILLDKDNNIIAGNGVIEAAGQIGMDKVKVVETNGNEIVAVKRTDVSIDSQRGRRMALADNATSQVDLEWDEGMVSEVTDEFGINTEDWGLDIGVKKSIKDEKNIEDNPPSIVASFITLEYADEIQLEITDETAKNLMKEMLKYRDENGDYKGFWDQRLKK